MAVPFMYNLEAHLINSLRFSEVNNNNNNNNNNKCYLARLIFSAQNAAINEGPRKNK